MEEGTSDLLARGHTFYVAVGGNGNGTNRNPFGDIQSAVDAAEAEGGGRIKVRPGTYELSAPVWILGSDITLEGSGRPLCAPDLDDPTAGAVRCDDDEPRGDLHPNGQMVPGTETRLEAVPGDFEGDVWEDANIQALIKVGCGQTWRWDDTCPDEVLHDVAISGLTLDAATQEARGGIEIRRTVDFEVTGVVIERGQHGVLTTGSTGRLSDNYIASINACGFCISAPLPDGQDGGHHADPDIEIVGNTVDGSTAAIFLFGASNGIRQQGDHLDADVRYNALRNSGLGARLSPQIRPAGSPGFEGVYGTVTVQFTGNEYSGNSSPYLFDTGFAYRRDVTGPAPFDFDLEGPSPCAPRWYSGAFDIRLTDEHVIPDANGPSQITFTRPYGSGWVDWQYLHYATYTIDDPDDVLRSSLPIGDPSRVRIDNPAYDPYQDLTPDTAPFTDACAPDRVYDLIGGPTLHPGTPRYATPTRLEQDLHNTLVINGVVMPHLQGAEGGVDCTGPLLSDCQAACEDGRDNDGDGIYDWDDPDCAADCNTFESVSGTGTDGSDAYAITFGETGPFSTTVHGLAAAETQAGQVDQDDFETPPELSPAWKKHQVDVPPGTALVRFDTYDDYTDQPHTYDLDLYVFDPLGALVGIGYTGTATERVQQFDPPPGTWDVWVNGYYTAGGLASYTLFSYVVGDDAGNLTVTAPAEGTAGESGEVDVDWFGLAPCQRYLGLIEHSGLQCHDAVVQIATDTSCPVP